MKRLTDNKILRLIAAARRKSGFPGVVSPSTARSAAAARRTLRASKEAADNA
jgi:hypothetical protein